MNASEDTLKMIQEAAFAYATPNPQRVKAMRERGQDIDPAVWKEIAELGWFSSLVPEERGGLGLGIQAVAILAERIGYAGMLEPFVPVAVIAAHCLAAAEKTDANRDT